MRVLFVAMPNSIHTVRWIDLISGRGWDVHLYCSIRALPHADLRTLTVHGHGLVFRPRELSRATRFAGTWPSAPSMTIFSSRGPNPISADIIKPDITAPGTQLLAGYSPTSYEVYDLPGELFAAIQGTSMSSPVVAGAFALLKQAHPDWSPAMAKSAQADRYRSEIAASVSPRAPFNRRAAT